MSKDDRWEIRIIHIQRQIEKINRYAADLSYEALLKDDKTEDALARCVQIIGEAASKVPQSIRERYPEIPWVKIISMRHIIVHDYYRVDLGVLYSTVTEDIPRLENLISIIPVPEEDT